MSRRDARRWLLAGGIVGLAASRSIARALREVRARAARAPRAGSDPVAGFQKAPCYQRSDWQEVQR